MVDLMHDSATMFTAIKGLQQAIVFIISEKRGLTQIHLLLLYCRNQSVS